MKMRMLWLVAGFTAAWIQYVSAATVQEAWTARYAGPLGRGSAKYIKVDAAGNVYVSGLSQGSNFWVDIVTVKYDANGNELWAARYDGAANRYDEPFGMTIDSAGNVYVTGFSQPSATNNDAVTIKYDTNGNQMWAALYDGPGHGHDQFNGISVDGSGNVYVSGSSTGVSNTPSLTVIKYNARGNVLWVSRDNGSGGAAAQAIDSAGNVYCTGFIGEDLGTVKFDTDGHRVWATRFVQLNSGNNYPSGIALDGRGNVYMTGSTPGTNGSPDYLVVKYDPSGNQLWFRTYDGPSHETDMVRGTAVDHTGSIYITGVSHGPVPGNPAYIGWDYATLRYNVDGTLLWVARYNAGFTSFGQSIAVDGAGNAIVTGIVRDLGPAPVTMATVKYDRAGRQVWEARRSPGIGLAVAVDNAGRAHVTGTAADGFGNGFLTIKYLEINSPPHADASATVPLAIAPNNRSARVALDGSRSSDPDDDLLDFSWSVRGIGFARGMVVTEELGVGRHTITLTVDDGIASDTDEITVAVITPCEAVQGIAEFLQRSGSTGSRRALLTTLDHACKSFDAGDIAGGVRDLQGFQGKVRAQVARQDPNLATELIRQAQAIIDAVTA